jgi:hypothetical protein
MPKRGSDAKRANSLSIKGLNANWQRSLGPEKLRHEGHYGTRRLVLAQFLWHSGNERREKKSEETNQPCPVKTGHSGTACRETTKLRVLRRNFFRRPDHFVNEFLELQESGGGDDNGVAPPANILGDAEKSPAGILLEGKNEIFPFNLNFAAFKRVLYNRGPWLSIIFGGTVALRRLIGPPTVGRWSFI